MFAGRIFTKVHPERTVTPFHSIVGLVLHWWIRVASRKNIETYALHSQRVGQVDSM